MGSKKVYTSKDMGLERFEVGSPFRLILKSLNRFLSQQQPFTFSTGPRRSLIQKSLHTNEGQVICFHFPKWDIWCQNPEDRRTIWRSVWSFLSDSKIIFYFTRNEGATTLVIQTHFCWVNIPMGAIFSPSCRPPSVLIVEKKVTPKSFLKSAENRWARSLWVGDHCYPSFSCASKLIWV